MEIWFSIMTSLLLSLSALMVTSPYKCYIYVYSRGITIETQYRNITIITKITNNSVMSGFFIFFIFFFQQQYVIISGVLYLHY